MSDLGVSVREQRDLKEQVTLLLARGLGCVGVNLLVYYVCFCGRSGLVRMSAEFLLPGMCCSLTFDFRCGPGADVRVCRCVLGVLF